MSAPFLCTAKFRSSLLLLLSLYALYPCVFPFSQSECDFPRPRVLSNSLRFTPKTALHRQTSTSISTDSLLTLSALSPIFPLILFSLIAAHHELARTHPKQPPCVVVRKVRGACRRARSKHKQGQNLTDDELQRRRRPSSRESPIKLNTGWGCPMKCCPNGPFH